MPKYLKFVFIAMIALAVMSPAWGQTGLSRVTGIVQDSSGAVVVGATVILTNEETGTMFTTTTTSAGTYAFPSVQPGTYTVTAEMKGFSKAISTKNVLTVGVPMTVNLTMRVGTTEQTVEVEGAFERVQTSTSGNLGGLIDNKTLTDLPLGLESGTGGRNPLIFIRLQPGLNYGSNTGGGSHINGARDRAFNYTLDGVDINETSAGGSEFAPLRTNPDSLQEFRVITSNATAEYGRNSGAQVALVTKSGTNNFHGNLFYFNRNSALAANEWENNFNGVKKPNLLQHQWGGSIGGPIRKNKTFFFFNYQGQRQKFPVTTTRTVYTPQARAGNFRYLVGGRNTNAAGATPTVDKSGNPLYPNCSATVTTLCIATYNIVANDPRGLGIDPAMKAWFDQQPTTGLTYLGGDGLNTAQFIFAPSRFDPQKDFVVKIDHKFNENNVIFGRWAWGRQTTDNDSTNSGLPKFPGLAAVVRTERDPKNLALSYRRVLTPRLVNEVLFGYNHFKFDFLTPELGKGLDMVTVNTTDPHYYGAGNLRQINTYQIVDNVSYNRGAHFFKAGVNFRLQQHRDQRGSVAGFNILPEVTFSSSSTNTSSACLTGSYGTGGTVGVTATGVERFCLPGTSGTLPINTNDIARLRGTINDLLGRVQEVHQGFVAKDDLSGYEAAGTYFKNNAWYPEYDFYFQDSWKVRRNLTVDVGVRWELKLTPRADNRLFTPDQLVRAGATPTNTLKWVKHELYQSDINNISPSIGFAWDPFSTGKTSIRANFRQANDRLATQLISSQIYNTIPGITLSVANTTFGSTGGPGGTGGRIRDGVPSLAPASSAVPTAFAQPAAFGLGSISVVDPALVSPKTYMWSLNIQRELPKDILVDLSYLGRRAQNLLGAYNANAVDVTTNGFVDAFNIVKAGGQSTLINQIYGVDTRKTATQTGSDFVRANFPTEMTRNNVTAIAVDATERLQGGVPLLQLAGLSPYFFRAFPQFRNINVIDSNDQSTYHAFQLTVQRKFSSGVTFQGAYTLSKSLDTRSYDPVFTVVSTGTNQSASSTPWDIYDRGKNYARSDFDRHHMFAGYAIWELPFGKGRHFAGPQVGFLQRIIEGWTITGDTRITTGRPFTVYSGANQFTNIVSSTADCACDGVGQFDAEGYNGVPGFFTTAQAASFSQPAAGSIGNTGRNRFTNPGVFNVDMAILKRTTVREGHNLELRFEFFNLTNSPSFFMPSGNAVITSSTFGRIADTLASESRKVRVGVKYNF